MASAALKINASCRAPKRINRMTLIAIAISINVCPARPRRGPTG